MSRKLSPWCKKVKKKLIDLDMTTTELAEVIGLSRGHVSAVVNGRSYLLFAGDNFSGLFIPGNGSLRRPVLHYLRCNQ